MENLSIIWYNLNFKKDKLNLNLNNIQLSYIGGEL